MAAAGDGRRAVVGGGGRWWAVAVACHVSRRSGIPTTNNVSGQAGRGVPGLRERCGCPYAVGAALFRTLRGLQFGSVLQWPYAPTPLGHACSGYRHDAGAFYFIRIAPKQNTVHQPWTLGATARASPHRMWGPLLRTWAALAEECAYPNRRREPPFSKGDGGQADSDGALRTVGAGVCVRRCRSSSTAPRRSRC